MADFLNITYNGKTETTVEDYLSQNKERISGLTTTDFLLVEDEFGERNLDKIYSEYYNEPGYAEKYKDSYLNGSLSVILPNTRFSVPKANVEIESVLLLGDNQFLKQEPFNCYISENLDRLVSDTSYVPAQNINKTGRGIDVQIINENCQVWIWCRALDQIINVSSFVSSLTTTKNEVGIFNISLDPIVDFDDILFSGGNAINLFPLQKPDKSLVMDLFEKKFQNNDVVFVRFEKLLLETENELTQGGQFEVNPYLLNDKVWDMIGLIDNVKSSYTASSSDKYVTIGGRDLMKMITDDAAYFIPLAFIEQSSKRFIYGGNKDDSFFKRNLISGAYDYYFSYAMKDIPSALGFIMNHLSNLGVTTEDLWANYTNKSDVRDVFGSDKNYIQSKECKGIWKIIKLFVDPVVNDRRIADDSLSNPDGSLYEFFKKICQEPFVEFWGDTNGSFFDFIVRQPPFTRDQMVDVINNPKYTIKVEKKDVLSYDLDFDDRYYAYYQIEPENTFLGEDKNSMLAYIPIIYLEQIAQNFGNKRLIVKDNYISMRALTGKNSDLNFDLFTSTLLPDYKYVIETNSYLPFTRKGSITINGDRRIKKGTFIELESTGEVFYVTGVSNSLYLNRSRIDRTTVLNVERGMVKKHITGKFETMKDISQSSYFNKDTGKVETRRKLFTYFDIVNSDLIYETIKRNLQPTTGQPNKVSINKENIKTEFGINQEVFDFFVQRKQFD